MVSRNYFNPFRRLRIIPHSPDHGIQIDKEFHGDAVKHAHRSTFRPACGRYRPGSQVLFLALSDWKFEKYPGDMDFYLIQTTDLEGKPGVGGGVGKRMNPEQHITPDFGVQNLDATLAKVKAAGGSVILSRMSVPGFGYMAVCMDTETNPFGLWQADPGAV
jgi:predicted enzyme related to lactoylglutathione lyase